MISGVFFYLWNAASFTDAIASAAQPRCCRRSFDHYRPPIKAGCALCRLAKNRQLQRIRGMVAVVIRQNPTMAAFSWRRPKSFGGVRLCQNRSPETWFLSIANRQYFCADVMDVALDRRQNSFGLGRRSVLVIKGSKSKPLRGIGAHSTLRQNTSFAQATPDLIDGDQPGSSANHTGGKFFLSTYSAMNVDF